ncbi:immunoglobulin-like domain-containing protein, partial [Bacillus sp. TD10]|uniref:immunoglobulin-like domain-containing protein n=1 Tax=Bacillus sp. TD10 TaxID=1672662 RepID=UPI00391A150F
ATDKEDGDLTNKITIEGQVDTSKVGIYELTYTVEDSKGHKVSAKQTVTVQVKEEIKDEVPLLKVPSETTISEGDKFDPTKDVSATDKEDGDLTNKITIEGQVDTSKVGIYELTYTVEDSKGHKVSVKQKVTVQERSVKIQDPEVSIPIEMNMNVGNKSNPMSRMKAINKEDGDIANEISHFGKINTSKTGNDVFKFLVRDPGSNGGTSTQKVIVKDTENVNSNILKNNTSSKKEDMYKELPKAGTNTSNSKVIGILMFIVGMVITFGLKLKKN